MKIRDIVFLGLITLGSVAQADSEVLRAEAQDDRLGARVRVREILAGKFEPQTWKWLEARVREHPEWGEDLYPVILEKAVAGKEWLELTPTQRELDRADEAMAARDYTEAARRYRVALSDRSELPRVTAQYARLSLARALYASKKFDEALQESRKIPPQFSRYRHVLFLRMWSAFRSGRVEMALGEIASQRSGYFGPYMEPESYILLIYLLKRLCREAEGKEVIAQVEQFLSELRSGAFDLKSWAKFEVSTLNYARILERPDPEGLDPKQREARERERSWVSRLLEKAFARKKKQWLEELPRVIAYSKLAITPGIASGLKPIEKIKSREKLLSQGYEIWPISGEEHWLDELGSHRYLGDSECGRN